jgi:hypothetical protein
MSRGLKLSVSILVALSVMLVSAAVASAGIPKLFWVNGGVQVKGNRIVSCTGGPPCEVKLVTVFVQPHSCEPSLSDYGPTTSITGYERTAIDKTKPKAVSLLADVSGVKAKAVELGWTSLSMCVYELNYKEGVLVSESSGEVSLNSLVVR